MPYVWTIALVGRTGTGKSASGNTILGYQAFTSRRAFTSVTETTAFGKRRIGNDTWIVFDTPGPFDTRQNDDRHILKEIGKSIDLAEEMGDGVDAICLAISAGDRFTKETVDTVEMLRSVFGKDMMDYLIIVLTRGDLLEKEGITINEYLRNIPLSFKRLLRECNYRLVVFNNRHKSDYQVQRLTNIIQETSRKRNYRVLKRPQRSTFSGYTAPQATRYSTPSPPYRGYEETTSSIWPQETFHVPRVSSYEDRSSSVCQIL